MVSIQILVTASFLSWFSFYTLAACNGYGGRRVAKKIKKGNKRKGQFANLLQITWTSHAVAQKFRLILLGMQQYQYHADSVLTYSQMLSQDYSDTPGTT